MDLFITRPFTKDKMARRIASKRGRSVNGGRPAKKFKKTFRKRTLNARTGGYLGLELKFLDCAWNAVTIPASTDGSGGELQPSSGCTNCMSCPAQGDGESQRDGRKFVMKSVWLSGSIDTSPDPDKADGSNVDGHYFALVLDTQANGATVVSESVYLNPGSSAANILPQPLRNLQNSKRFRILASQFVAPGGAYAQTDGTNTASISAQNSTYVSLSWRGSLNVDTIGTTADVASVSNNAIHLVAYAGSTQLSPVFRGKSRMRFMG